LAVVRRRANVASRTAVVRVAHGVDALVSGAVCVGVKCVAEVHLALRLALATNADIASVINSGTGVAIARLGISNTSVALSVVAVPALEGAFVVEADSIGVLHGGSAG